MTVKTYRARSMQEALALVRQELGSQAAVLHTREVRSRGLSRLWGGELIEVVASDNVSVPGRLPDPYLNARERSVPQSPAGIDLTEMSPPGQQRIEGSPDFRSRIADYLDQGLQPLAVAGEIGQQRKPVSGGVPLLLVCGAEGAGATTVSWNLAQALAAQGRRAVWVDADLTLRADATPPDNREAGLADILTGRRTVHEVLSLGPDGVQCVRRAQGTCPPVISAHDAQRCVQQFTGLSPHAEIVIVDGGSKANLLQDELWRAASTVCVVVTPAEDTVLRGYAHIKRNRQSSQFVKLVMLVNRAGPSSAERISRQMAQACQQFLNLGVSWTASLPEADVSAAGRAFEQFAERLWDSLDAAERPVACAAASTRNL